jgi:hypothetical protein
MKGGESGVLNVYEPFIKELRAVYGGFVDNVEELCRSKLMDDFETFTKILDWDLLTGLSDLGKEYAYFQSLDLLSLLLSGSSRSSRTASIMPNDCKYDYLARDAGQTQERVAMMMQRNESSASTSLMMHSAFWNVVSSLIL